MFPNSSNFYTGKLNQKIGIHKGDQMTICIAAIGKDGKEEIIVAATDHMITMGNLGQFEHTISKYKEINKDVIAMLSGIPLLFDDLVRMPDGTPSYSEIKAQIKKNFKSKRNEIFQDHVLDLYGITWEKFIESATQAFPNPLIEEMMKTNTKFKLKSSILLAGFDGNKAILSEISERTYADFRDMNFHAIGSGSIQAVNTLMFQKHDKNDSLSATIYDVYKAKRNAEVAQGVGKETELIVLTKGKGCKTLTGESFKALKDIYDEEVKVGRNHPTLKKLKFGGRGGPCS
jgi:20S proteasome alpha/beta subunit